MRDGRVGVEFSRALDACRQHPGRRGRRAAAPPAAPAAAPAPRPPAWLNLGAAGSGQAITIDASSLEQDGATRTAWFRMTDPAPAPPSLHSYRLRIDCARRTIQPLGHRRYDAAGAIAESRDIGPRRKRRCRSRAARSPRSPISPCAPEICTDARFWSISARQVGPTNVEKSHVCPRVACRRRHYRRSRRRPGRRAADRAAGAAGQAHLRGHRRDRQPASACPPLPLGRRARRSASRKRARPSTASRR